MPSDHHRERAEAAYRQFLAEHDDDELTRLCSGRSRKFLPDTSTAVAEISQEIRAHLVRRESFSLLRFGDGEGNVLAITGAAGGDSSLARDFFDAATQKQDRVTLGAEEANLFAETMRHAIESADVVGARSVDAQRRSSGLDDAMLIGATLDRGDVRGAMGLLSARLYLQRAVAAGVFTQSVITSAWIHLALVPHLRGLLDAASRVLVISGRRELVPVFERRLGARLEEFLVVPREASRRPESAPSHFLGAYPMVLDALRRDLRGCLVLVGAGLFGKAYCQAAKDGGGVAIDLGSAFDVLAGEATRPAHRDLVDWDDPRVREWSTAPRGGSGWT